MMIWKTALLASLILYHPCAGQSTRPIISLAGQPGVSIANFEVDSLGNLYLAGNATDFSGNPVSPSLAVSRDGSGLLWRPVDTPYRTLTVLAASRTDPDVVWANAMATSGQVELVQSRNGGRTWSTVRDGAHTGVAVNPSNPRVILAHSNFVYRSTDGGVTWTRTSNGTTSPRLDFDPFGSGTAVSWGGLDSRISSDAGTSWKDLLESSKPIPVDAFVFDQTKPGTAYCSARTGSTPAEPATIFRTRDLRTWTPVAKWNSPVYPRSLFSDPAQPGRLWAAATNSVDGDLVIGELAGGIYRSDDEGETWVRVSAIPAQSITGCGGAFLAVGSTLIRGAAGGTTWAPIPQALTLRSVNFGAGCVAYAANFTMAARPRPPYVARYSPAGDRLAHFPGLSFDAVSPDGDFALQSADLVLYDPEGKERFRVPRTEDPAYLLFGPDRSLHAVSRTRIYKWDRSGKPVYARNLAPGLASNSSAPFPAAVVDRNGRLILAPASGVPAVVIFDEAGENPTAVSAFESIPVTNITALAIAPDGDLVAAGLTNAAVPNGACSVTGGAWFGRFRTGDTIEPLWQRTLAAANTSVRRLMVDPVEGAILAGFASTPLSASSASIWVENLRPFGERISSTDQWVKLSPDGDLIWSTPIDAAMGSSVRSVRGGRLFGLSANAPEVVEILPEERRQDAGVDNVVDALSGERPVQPRAGSVTIITLNGRNFGPAEDLDLGLNEQNPPFDLNGVRVEAGGKPLPLLAAGPTSITAILDLSGSNADAPVRLRVISEQNGPMDPVSITAAGTGAAPRAAVLREGHPCPSGPQIVYLEDGTRNSRQNPAAPGSTVTALATGLDPLAFPAAVGFAPGVYAVTARIPADASGGLASFPSTAPGIRIEAWIAPPPPR